MPVTLFPYGLISRHGAPKVLGYYILHEGLIGVMGDQGLQEETYKNIDEKRPRPGTSPTLGSALPTNIGQRVLLPDTDAKVRARFSAGEAGARNLSDRLSVASRRPSRPARPAADAGCLPAPRKSRWSASIPVLASRRLQRGAASQPFRSVDRLGLVLLHHQADVPRHRLFLPSGRQFRHRHSDRHGPGEGAVLPARQQVLRLDGEDEGGAAADGDDQRALRRRPDEAATGDDGAVQEGADQSGCRLPADRDSDSVFFSLYKVLFITIEMRHAPFYGWIHDLSAPDPTTSSPSAA